MSQDPIPTTFASISKAISAELKIDEQIVRAIIRHYVEKIKVALKHELPVSMEGFGKFYCTYRKPPSSKTKPLGEYYLDKVIKTIKFKLHVDAKNALNAWVHDLGIRDNTRTELMKVAIEPTEISKIRRRKMLEEQQKVGFRPDLLFDEEHLPEHDKKVLEDLGESPTIEEIKKRIAFYIEND